MARITAAKSEIGRLNRLQRQSLSRKMLKVVIMMIRKLRSPKFACSFEWPDHCDGFNEELCLEMHELRLLLPFEVQCHGCAYGLADALSKSPILKPWRILGNTPGILEMEKKCPGHKQHAQLFFNPRCVASRRVIRSHSFVDLSSVCCNALPIVFACRTKTKTGLSILCC